MDGEQHPARFLCHHVVEHAGTQHENLLRAQIVRLPSSFALGFYGQCAVQSVNCDQTVGFVVSECAAGLKGNENDGRRVTRCGRSTP